jgi:hypothetical protein
MLSSDNRTQRLFQFHTVFKLQPLKKPNKIITGNIPAITGNLQRSNFVIRNNGEIYLTFTLTLYQKRIRSFLNTDLRRIAVA